jgi:superfamily II DNA/RNA helicase
VSKTILGNFLFIYLFNELTQDHIERGSIDLSQLKFRVLDEADEMLRMGFVEDVELILGVCL